MKKLFRKYNYFISFTFFPFIYLLGWLIISILIYPFSFLSVNKSLYGTIITFLIFLFCLPYWCKYKWGKGVKEALGIINLNRKELFFILILEFLKALLIILSICLIAVLGGYANFAFEFNHLIVLNAIFLGLIVGFAEELVFRVWLFEELNLFIQKKNANILQAFIFSFVHLRSDFNFFSNAQLILGLFLLGIYLNRWRENKRYNILVPICFHSSIVSLWFLIINCFLDIQINIPKTLFGPGQGDEINPIGGILGIILISLLCFFKSSGIIKNLLKRNIKLFKKL